MHDRHCPTYHFMPPANWMNDPNGLIQWQGTYHLFYQHNPHAAYWGPMHWGHAASLDLVHWQHLPIALAPVPGGPDQSGVWSGCAVNWDGRPALVYTARDGERETVCLATSQDGLLTWDRYPGNPVISAPPPLPVAPPPLPVAPPPLPVAPPLDLKTLGFRDPCVWRADGRWYMVLGSGIEGVGGAILLYTSSNLTDWQYLGLMITGDRTQTEPYWTGEMWECPNFFPLGDRYVLLISAMGVNPGRGLYTLYFVGRFDGKEFVPERMGKLDGGDLACYAPQAFRDEQGRRVMFGWSREMRSQEADVEAGWSGMLTLPRLLELTAQGGLCIRPAPEIEVLRGEGRTWEDLRIEPSGSSAGWLAPDGLSGDCLELAVDFSPDSASSAGAFGLWVRRSPDAEEQTEIRFDRQTKRLVVDTRRASLDRTVYGDRYELPLEITGQEHLRLRVFLDRSILEVYGNDQVVFTARVYPTRADSLGIGLFAEQVPALVRRLQAWQINPAR